MDVDWIANKAFARSDRKLSQTEFHKSAITNHVIDWKQSQIMDRENDQRTRQIREAIQIRFQRDVKNRDEGAYRLKNIYDPFFAIVSGGNKRN